MVCDTTVRAMADGSWLLFILAGDTREPSPKNFIGVTRNTDQGKTWSKLKAFDCGLPRSGQTVGQGPTELIVTDKEALLFFATHGDTFSWGKRWKSWLLRGSPDGKSWGKPVATGKGTGPRTEIVFPAQPAKFIRITQTGSAPNKF